MSNVLTLALVAAIFWQSLFKEQLPLRIYLRTSKILVHLYYKFGSL